MKPLDNKSGTKLVLLADVLVKQGKIEEVTGHLRKGFEIAQAKGANNMAEDIRKRLQELSKRGTNDSNAYPKKTLN
jgi:hypothetical protein